MYDHTITHAKGENLDAFKRFAEYANISDVRAAVIAGTMGEVSITFRHMYGSAELRNLSRLYRYDHVRDDRALMLLFIHLNNTH